ncbi:MAG: hypothetical protein R6X35_01945 [Candidatus Krumholzibacteriia bacterium]
MTTLMRTLVLAGAVTALLAAAATARPLAPDLLARHLRLEARLDEAADLAEPQRARMRLNLQACRTLGLDPDGIAMLFPGRDADVLDPATALRLQSQVIRAARGELPIEPLLAKIREGRRKGAPAEALVQAGEKVVAGLEAAGALLAAGEADGLTPAADPAGRQEQIRSLTRTMWRGLTPEDGARLRARARERLQHGSCGTGDLAAAAEVAVRIREHGGDREDALHLAGAALAQGYNAAELTELGHAVTAGRLGGGDLGALLADLADHVDQGLGAGALHRYLRQGSWLGPGDVPGAGGPGGTGGHQGGGPGGGPGGPGGGAPTGGDAGTGGATGTSGAARGGGSR